MNPSYRRARTIYQMPIQSIHSLLRTAPALQSIVLALPCVVAESPKGHLLSIQLLSDGREHGKNFMAWAYCCISSGVSSLINSNVMWNAMMMNEAFCKSMDSGFVRREGKSVSKVSVYSSKN